MRRHVNSVARDVKTALTVSDSRPRAVPIAIIFVSGLYPSVVEDEGERKLSGIG